MLVPSFPQPDSQYQKQEDQQLTKLQLNSYRIATVGHPSSAPTATTIRRCAAIFHTPQPSSKAKHLVSQVCLKNQGNVSSGPSNSPLETVFEGTASAQTRMGHNCWQDSIACLPTTRMHLCLTLWTQRTLQNNAVLQPYRQSKSVRQGLRTQDNKRWQHHNTITGGSHQTLCSTSHTRICSTRQLLSQQPPSNSFMSSGADIMRPEKLRVNVFLKIPHN